MDARQEVKSLKKALRALTFMNQRGDTTVSDVARAIGVPRPTSYRILETLASEGYVEKQPHSGLYRITSMVQRLAAGFHEVDQLIEIAKPMIYELGQELGWPITLSTPHDRYMISRVNTDFDSALALERYNIGVAASILCATTGYCYLAYCSESERNEMLEHALRRDNSAPKGPHTLDDDPDEIRCLTVTQHMNHLTRFNNNNPEEISYLLKIIRDHGFCNLEFKRNPEGNVGVPLFQDGKPVGGIVMRYIKSVMKNTDRIQHFYVPKLQQLAQNISDAYNAQQNNTSSMAKSKSKKLDEPVDKFAYP